METFSIKRGDTSPVIRYALKPATADIAGSTVQFQMRSRSGVLMIDSPATIISGFPAVVQYAWQGLDTDVTGLFDAEFRVTYFDGGIETFPNTSFIKIRIMDDVR